MRHYPQRPTLINLANSKASKTLKTKLANDAHCLAPTCWTPKVTLAPNSYLSTVFISTWC